MVIGTQVFIRIVQEVKEAATDAVAETMVETVRFGTFPSQYVRECAKDRLQKHINKYQSAIPA